MPQSPSKTEVRKARVSKEEKTVQRIVDLLNEKGYEYERDARPLICWKFNVASSRDLTLEQKEKVKKALEDGSFEKWGEQYKNDVLGNQVDVVKQIEAMASAGEQTPESSGQAQKETKLKKTSKPRKSTTATSKKDIEKKITAPVKPLLKNEQKEASGKEGGLLESSNLKIETLAKPTGIDKKQIKLKINDDEKEKTAIKPIESKTSSLSAESIQQVNISNKDKSDTVIQDEGTKISVTPSKKDQLSVKVDASSEKFEMGYEEAQKIVKARYLPELYKEVSVGTVVLIVITIFLFLMSLTINFILITGKTLPGWVKFICNIIS